MVLYFSIIEESYNLPKLPTFSLFQATFGVSGSHVTCHVMPFYVKSGYLYLFYKISESSYVSPINTREKRKVMQYLDASLVSMLSAPLSSENPP